MNRAPGGGHRRRVAVLVIVSILAVVLTGCSSMGGRHRDMMGGGEDTRSEQRVEGSGDILVEIADFAFSPGNLQVAAGTSITWINRDAVPHTATAVDGSWDTGLLIQGESFAIRFDVAGVYDYACTPHPDMKARVEVVAT